MEKKPEKSPKKRSRLYPRYDIENSIRFIEIVSKLGGSGVSNGAVAAEVGKSINNSTFIGRISSAKQFGLLVPESGKLSISTIGREIMFPRGDSEKSLAIKNAFSTPSLYKELIKAFNGRIIPDQAALGNRLVHDYGIEVNVKDGAARNFIRSAQYAGVLQNGILVIDVENNSTNNTDVEDQNAASNQSTSSRGITGSEGKFVFEFDGEIKLIIPRNKQTSGDIADGALKDVNGALKKFAKRYSEKTDADNTN